MHYIKKNMFKCTPDKTVNMKSVGIYSPIFGARALKAFNEEAMAFINLPKLRWDD